MRKIGASGDAPYEELQKGKFNKALSLHSAGFERQNSHKGSKVSDLLATANWGNVAMRLRVSASVIALLTILLPATVTAEQETVRWNDWQLTFDSQTGDWLSLRWRGQIIAREPQSGNLASVDISVGEREGQRRWLIEGRLSTSRLTYWHFDPKTATLTLTREVSVDKGRWQFQELIQFGAFDNPNRITRNLRLTWTGNFEMRPSGR